MSLAVSGALIGLVLALGVCLVVAWSPPARRPSLDDRLAPYLRDAPRPSRLLAAPDTLTPFPTVERLLGPVLRDLMRVLDQWFRDMVSLRHRLVQAGRGMTVEEFRAEQVVWGAFGLLAGLVVSVLALASGGGPPAPALLVLCVGLTALGVVLRDRWLTRSIQQREQRMLAEFPTIAELLALAVTAGEGPVGALERVCRISTGELARELRAALADARSGASLVQALEGIATRTSLAPLARFVDGIAIAVERGTPLAEVLRAQAVDVREASKRALLESGGKREIAMLVPVVFLVLPVTIVFALFPGFYGFSVITP